MKKIFFVIVCSYLVVACRKDELLNERPKSNLVIPSSLQDFQAMMDYGLTMNVAPVLGDASSDNYYITNTSYASLSPQAKNLYTWQTDIFQGQNNISDWNLPYAQILKANIALEGLAAYKEANLDTAKYNFVKGHALFVRAFAHFNLLLTFSKAYDPSSASTDLGIPLKLSADIDEKSTRASIQQVYDQVIKDVVEAKSYLPGSIDQINRNRPSKAAAFALLSKIYLNMRRYSLAGAYADSSLQMYNNLTDLNSVPQSSSRYNPYTRFNNVEVLYSAWQTTSSSTPGGVILSSIFGTSDQISIDTTLFRSYDPNDLRKKIYFFVRASNGAANLNGGYSGGYDPFAGLATNEMYLIRAECNARDGKISEAMSDLNFLLQKRWKAGTVYTIITASGSADALNKVLIERRKELPLSGVRWFDLKRLNKEGYNYTLTRNISGQTFTLLPNDPKWVFPIPDQVIQISGIPQNPR